MLESVVEQWLDQEALIEGKMYATSLFYSQIYPSLLPGRQFPNLAGVYPLRPPAGLLGALSHNFCLDVITAVFFRCETG